MVVGISRLVFALPFCDSLKGKRSVVKSLLERTRHKFNVAAAEVDDMDVHRRAVLGFVVVSNDRRHANSMLDHIADFAVSNTEAELIDRQVEIANFGELDGE